MASSILARQFFFKTIWAAYIIFNPSQGSKRGSFLASDWITGDPAVPAPHTWYGCIPSHTSCLCGRGWGRCVLIGVCRRRPPSVSTDSDGSMRSIKEIFFRGQVLFLGGLNVAIEEPPPTPFLELYRPNTLPAATKLSFTNTRRVDENIRSRLDSSNCLFIGRSVFALALNMVVDYRSRAGKGKWWRMNHDDVELVQ